MKSLSLRTVCRFTVLAAIFVMAMHADPARADCMEICMGRWNCDFEFEGGSAYDSDNSCQPYLHGCEMECSTPDQRVYGAIAYDKTTGAWGMSDESIDKEGAVSSAMAYCRNNGGPKCVTVFEVSRICAALASGSNNIVAWAKGATQQEAEASAKKSCAPKNGGSCTVLHSTCYQ